MTRYLGGSFSVGDTGSGGDAEKEKEKQEGWDRVFKARSCSECVRLDWVQVYAQNVDCPSCKKVLCPYHLKEHTCAPKESP